MAFLNDKTVSIVPRALQAASIHGKKDLSGTSAACAITQNTRDLVVLCLGV